MAEVPVAERRGRHREAGPDHGLRAAPHRQAHAGQREHDGQRVVEHEVLPVPLAPVHKRECDTVAADAEDEAGKAEADLARTGRPRDVDSPAEPDNQQGDGLDDLEGDDVTGAPERPGGDADQVRGEDRQLQQHHRPGTIPLPDAGDRAGHHQDAAIRDERHWPAQPDPVERVAHPERGHSQKGEVEPERRRGPERGQEDQRGQHAGHRDDPRQAFDAPAPRHREAERGHGGHRERRDLRRHQVHPHPRFPEDRERDEGGGHPVKRRHEPSPRRVEPVREAEPGHGVDDAQQRARDPGQRTGVGEHAQQIRAGEHEARSADQRQHVDEGEVSRRTRGERGRIGRQPRLRPALARSRGPARLHGRQALLEARDEAGQLADLPLETRETVVHRHGAPPGEWPDVSTPVQRDRPPHRQPRRDRAPHRSSGAGQPGHAEDRWSGVPRYGFRAASGGVAAEAAGVDSVVISPAERPVHPNSKQAVI